MRQCSLKKKTSSQVYHVPKLSIRRHRALGVTSARKKKKSGRRSQLQTGRRMEAKRRLGWRKRDCVQ